MSRLEPLFHALELELLVPAGGVGQPPSRESELRGWWDDVKSREGRDTAFLDEKLSYAVALTLPTAAFEAEQPESDISSADPSSRSSASATTPAELRTLARNVQLTATAAFLPPVRTPAPGRLSIPAQQRLSVQTTGPTTPRAQSHASAPGTPGTPTAARGGPDAAPARAGGSPGAAGGAAARAAAGADRAAPRAPPPDAPGGGVRTDAPAAPAGAGAPGGAAQQDGAPPAQAQAGAQGPAPGQPGPGPVAPGQAQARGGQSITPAALADGAPPLTPVPLPFTTGADARYAAVEGVTIWEGAVETPDDARPVVFKTAQGWTAVWRGEVPVVYVRTQIAAPVLALTVSATLREGAKKARAGNDAASIMSARTEETAEESDDEGPDVAEMEEIDLFGGLVEDRMPASRLGPSLRADLNIPPPPAHTTISTPVLPTPVRSGSGSSTLRKSFRRVLELSSGLRVRMRTLFLPQLLPPGSANDIESEEGERRIVVCVEVENGPDSGAYSFSVADVGVDVGGKGAKATTELLCQPGQDSTPPKPTFPISLSPLEQYNLLYVVSIAASNTAEPRGKADEHRPVTIVLTGAPVRGGISPTAAFESRWNCALDLGPFYASLPPAPPAPAASAPAPRHAAHRISKPTPPTPNAIAGDKRYSLATLLGNDAAPKRPGARFAPVPPVARVVSARGAPVHSREDGHGLLVSVKLLGSPDKREDGEEEGEAGGAAPRIKALDTFSIEVFVHNRTDAVRRFRLAVPAREGAEGRVRDLWARRRKRGAEEQAYGADDAVLAAMLAQHEAAAPALVPLETDIRCGPLLPGASLSTRIRFLALREGTHKIERLRLTGTQDEFDFVISPVLEVVVS